MSPELDLSVLTPEEWNAAYFLGLEAIFRRGCRCNVSEQVLEGLRLLVAAGYRVRSPSSRVARLPARRSPSDVHERSCQQLATGTFDAVGRARRAARWINTRVPQVSTAWIVWLVETHDRLHPKRSWDGPTAGKPPQAAVPPTLPAPMEGILDG